MGGLYGHPHGYCCAVSMPPIMEYNLPVSTDKYARLAVSLGAGHPGYTPPQLAAAAVAAIRDLRADLGVPSMGDLIRAEDLDVLAHKAEANTSTPSNPRDVAAADYRAMFAREMAVDSTHD
jgi:lactaldehyde reductase